MTDANEPKLKLIIPKGRLQDKIEALLGNIGIHLSHSSRSYRPICSDPDIEVKLLKPQNVPSLLALGRHDCGFTGHDWILENGADQDGQVSSLLDLKFDKVRIVAAVPEELLENPQWKSKQLVVASEYPNLARKYLDEQKLNAVLIKTYGATEALPPEDADMIIDNTSTGSTLRANRLEIIGELMTSTTHFACGKAALADPWKKEKLEQMTMLIQSTLNAREKVLLEMNVSKPDFDKLVTHLPAMRSPTVAPLYGEEGFAVKVAVPAKEVSRLIPQLIAMGARDILEYRLEKLVQ